MTSDRLEGSNGQIAVKGDVLVLTRDGLMAKTIYNKVPVRRIPLAALSDVRLVQPGGLSAGALVLGLGGEAASAASVKELTTEPNAVLFNKGKAVAKFAEMHTWLQAVVETNKQTGVDSAAVAYDPPQLGKGGKDMKARITGGATSFDIARAAEVKMDLTDALFTGQSHESGRNSVVTLYPDRLERVRAARLSSMSKARQDTEVTPVKAISSVQAKKDGILWTKVTVFASGNNIEFRFGHDEALRFKDKLMGLILGNSTPAPVVVQQAAAAPDLADQLMKLAALRDQGILTEDEFAAQKAKLLA